MLKSRIVPALTMIGALLFASGAVVLALYYRPYRVAGPSMMNTLHVNDRMIADISAAGGNGVRRGDLVLLAPDAFVGGDGDNVVKRVIGVGGDRVVCCDAEHRVVVNGHPLAEDYLYPGSAGTETPFDVTVPDGRLFVLGDHRAVSMDSRAHLGDSGRGTVPLSAVLARVVAVVYPLSRLGEIPGGADPRYLLAGDAVLAGLGLLALAAVVLKLPRVSRSRASRP
ncbi:signal peptidase I [Amycolatopsis alkalitolerans]|uniref:Signal peptidase I n=1 Tax=Amycolatopsis alkalitolerans TaxID=2547244 RepID=A0A5C4LQ71_9PSEU|nr:signal peptidase I [Amycolatopsis alkalitolerans]TNC18877.1 signal peptidase I [Amycolatopsis alkalitolerans]